MFPKLFLSSLCVCFCSSAYAGCVGGSTPLFHCSFNGGKKVVDVCLQGRDVHYSFGPPASAAELHLKRLEIDVALTPWNGVGRSIWEEISLYNEAYSYNLSYAIDRNLESAPIDGRLIVGEGDSEVAELVCDVGSVKHANFYPLFEAKESAGQRYCSDSLMWDTGC